MSSHERLLELLHQVCNAADTQFIPIEEGTDATPDVMLSDGDTKVVAELKVLSHRGLKILKPT